MKFRKKPVVIDAVQFTSDDEACITALKEMGLTPAIVCYDKKTHAPSLSIKTLEGTMVANVGDWVIKGVNGEFYPCKDDIFKKTYEGSASTVGMPFGQAIEALKAGKKVARRGWNGKNQFLWLKPATTVESAWCKDPELKKLVDDNGGTLLALGTVCMYTHDGTGRRAILTGWLASQSDILLEDWEIVP